MLGNAVLGSVFVHTTSEVETPETLAAKAADKIFWMMQTVPVGETQDVFKSRLQDVVGYYIKQALSN